MHTCLRNETRGFLFGSPGLVAKADKTSHLGCLAGQDERKMTEEKNAPFPCKGGSQGKGKDRGRRSYAHICPSALRASDPRQESSRIGGKKGEESQQEQGCKFDTKETRRAQHLLYQSCTSTHHTHSCPEPRFNSLVPSLPTLTCPAPSVQCPETQAVAAAAGTVVVHTLALRHPWPSRGGGGRGRRMQGPSSPSFLLIDVDDGGLAFL